MIAHLMSLFTCYNIFDWSAQCRFTNKNKLASELNSINTDKCGRKLKLFVKKS